MFENHVVGEILGLGGIKLLAFYTKVSVCGGELEDFVALLGDFGGRKGNEGTDGGSGGDERNKLCVHKFDGVGFPREEGVDDFLRDGEGLLGVGVLTAVVDLADDVVTTLEVAGSLLADEDHVNIDALGLELVGTGLGLFDHEGVVATAETTISGDDDKGDLVDLTLGEKGEVGGLSSEAVDESPEDGLEGLREGTGGKHGILGATHLGGGDKFHGRSNLLGVVHCCDTVANGY